MHAKDNNSYCQRVCLSQWECAQQVHTYRVNKKVTSATVVDISAVRATFWMKFFNTVKQ